MHFGCGVGDFQTNHRRFAPGVPARDEERVCAMLFQETILQRLGKALHVHWDDIAREPMPRRWVDLILFLEEKERKRSERRPEAAPQRH
jgi:hypothetical protein